MCLEGRDKPTAPVTEYQTFLTSVHGQARHARNKGQIQCTRMFVYRMRIVNTSAMVLSFYKAGETKTLQTYPPPLFLSAVAFSKHLEIQHTSHHHPLKQVRSIDGFDYWIYYLILSSKYK